MPNLSALLNARSVAIVGASTREGTFSWHLLRQLLAFGYSGAIVPVHPTATEIAGLRAFPTCSAIGQAVDCAAICVGDDRLEAALLDVIAAGIPAAVIFGTAATTATDGRPLTAWIAETSRAHGLALLGANCMGLFNFGTGLFLNGYPYHREPREGSVGFITHSGSLFSAVAKNTRGLDFNLVVSPGQELVLTAADYLRYLIDLASTRVVGLVLEAVRDPAGFVAALQSAAERDIPVVLLKIGRTERGAEMAMAHTGAIAGQHATVEALAARYNVCLVRTMDEMMDTLELFAAGRPFTVGELAAVADSGGERGLMVDLASDWQLPWAELSPQTIAILEQTLDPGLAAVNPVDLWGTGKEWQQVFRTVLSALLNDPNVGALNFGIDFNVGSRLNADYRQIAIDTARGTTKPVAVVTNIAAGTDPSEAALLRAAGVPVLLGTQTGLGALAHLRRWSRRSAEVSRWQAPQLSQPTLMGNYPHDRPWTEAESMSALTNQWIRPPRMCSVATGTEAVSAANEIGYPVVLKTAQPGITHKSDRSGVIVNLTDARMVEAAWTTLNQNLGPLALVQKQIDRSGGTELILGARSDPQFGAVVTLGLGGIWTEVLRDTISFLAPVTPTEVVARLSELRGYALLSGARGKTAIDVPTLAASVAAFSATFAASIATIAVMEINPLLAAGSSLIMLDALVYPVGAGVPSSGSG